MATDLGMFIDIRAGGAQQAAADIDRVAKSADDLEKKAGGASGRVKELGDGISETGSNASQASGYMGLLSKAITGIITIQTVRAIFAIGDGYNVMSDRVRMATNSLSEYPHC